MGEWDVEKGIWVVPDEIFERLVYDDNTVSSMPVLVPALADRCFVVNGVAKTYAMTGWRVGWMIGPHDVIKAATNLQSHATSNVSNVAQAAAVAAVTRDLAAVAIMREAVDRRRRTMTALLNEIPRVVARSQRGQRLVRQRRRVVQLVGGAQQQRVGGRPPVGCRTVGDAGDLLVGEPGGPPDDEMLAPLVLGPAPEAGPEDQQLALARRQLAGEQLAAERQPLGVQAGVADE